MPAPSLRELRREPGEPSAPVATRVAAARDRQQERFPGRPLPINAAMDAADVRRWCGLEEAGERLLAAAFDRLGLSARAMARVLKVARTIADLAGAERLAAAHLAEAIQYRALERRAPGPPVAALSDGSRQRGRVDAPEPSPPMR